MHLTIVTQTSFWAGALLGRLGEETEAHPETERLGALYREMKVLREKVEDELEVLALRWAYSCLRPPMGRPALPIGDQHLFGSLAPAGQSYCHAPLFCWDKAPVQKSLGPIPLAK